jgi:hypothetical protein
MSRANGNGHLLRTFSEARRARYEEFTAAMRAVPRFIRDPIIAVDSLADDHTNTYAARVVAWVKRESWGNYSLHCIHEDGTPAFQADCAKALNIDKRRVSKAIAYHEARGRIRVSGKLLYPVISPVPPGLPEQSPEKSPEWGTFLQLWKVAHPSDFHDLQVARSRVKQLQKVLLSDYKKWLALGRSSLLTQIPSDPDDLARSVRGEIPRNERPSSSSSSFATTTMSSTLNETNLQTRFPEKVWEHAHGNTTNAFPKIQVIGYFDRCLKIAAARGETLTEDDVIAIMQQTQNNAAGGSIGKFTYYMTAAEEQTNAYLDHRWVPKAKHRAVGSLLEQVLDELNEERADE